MKTIISLLIVLVSSVCYAEEGTLQTNSVKGDPAVLRVEEGTMSVQDILGYTVDGKDTVVSSIIVQCVIRDSISSFGGFLATGAFWGTVLFGDSVCKSMQSYDCFVARFSPTGALLWLRITATQGNEFGHAVAIDQLGRVHVVGVFDDSVFTKYAFPKTHTNMTGTDAFLATYDPTGMYCRRKVIVSGAGTNAAFAVTTDIWNYVYITGVFRGTATIGNQVRTATGVNENLGDVFMIKIAPDGQYVVVQTYGTEYADERGVYIGVGYASEQVAIFFDINIPLLDSSMSFLVFPDYGMTAIESSEECSLCITLHFEAMRQALKPKSNR